MNAENNFSLTLLSAAQSDEQTKLILAQNRFTASHGLSLTPSQALSLEKTRIQALEKNGRVELSRGITDKIIRKFCDSLYISRDNYEEVLHELIEIFYSFKNDTLDRVSDERLLDYMKNSFDGECRGSLELLAGDALVSLVKKLNEQNGAERFDGSIMTDD